jgi:F-type H+-transporting ATPase subunit b
MEVLSKFGINPVLLVAQIVNFLIILFIVKKYALKPILKMLKDRETTIKNGLQQAEDAKKLLEDTAEKERDVLKKAHTQARELLDEAKKDGEELLAKAETKTHQQIEKMLSEAREQISSETAQAEKRLMNHISDLAVKLIEKSSSELFTEKEQSIIMEKAVKNLKKKAD